MVDKCPGTIADQRFPGTLFVPHFRFATLLQHAILKKHFATDEVVPSGFVVKASFEAFNKRVSFLCSEGKLALLLASGRNDHFGLN